MQRLAERQGDFAAALLDPGRPMPIGLVGPDGEPSPKRFAVYRNNVVVGLMEALKDAFPAVHRIVGADFFRAMARAYARVEPPRSPIMLDYGAGFPDFVRQFEPAAVLPYLAVLVLVRRRNAFRRIPAERSLLPVGYWLLAAMAALGARRRGSTR